jgi:hypothetical protein
MQQANRGANRQAGAWRRRNGGAKPGFQPAQGPLGAGKTLTKKRRSTEREEDNV